MSDPILTTPTYQLQPSPKKKYALIALAVLAVAILGAAGYYFRSQLISFFTPLQLPDAMLVLSAGTLPANVTLIEDGEARPLMVPETGEFLKVTDAAFVGTSTAYYLISDPLYLTSNLYRQDLGTEGRPITQLTNSQTFKSHLSVAPQGDLFAYESKSGTSTIEVMVYSVSKNTEELIVEGTNPVVSPDGAQVAFLREGRYMVIDRVTGIIRTLIDQAPGAPTAIDMGSRHIAVFNSQRGQIEEYSFTGTEDGVTFAGLHKVSFTPAALTYLDGHLLYASAVSAERPTVTVRAAGSRWSTSATLPEGHRLEGLTQYSLTAVAK